MEEPNNDKEIFSTFDRRKSLGSNQTDIARKTHSIKHVGENAEQ